VFLHQFLPNHEIQGSRPAKRFGEYHGSDKIFQLTTESPPGTLAIIFQKTGIIEVLGVSRSFGLNSSSSSAFQSL
jgi:hypothetical protein